MESNQDLNSVIQATISAALCKQNAPTGQTLVLPEYHGIGSTLSFKSWYSKCMNLFEAFAIKDEVRMVANLKLQLRGTAETSLATYLLNNLNDKLFNTQIFYEKLSPYFIDPSYPQVLRRKLQLLSQTGSLSEYISNEANLIGDFKGISDAERIYLFKYGLDNKFVDILNLKNPETFIEAINLISRHGTALDMRLAQNNIQKSIESNDAMDIDLNRMQIRDTNNYETSLKFDLLNDSYAPDTFLYSINGVEVPIHVAGRVGRTYLNNNMVCWNCGLPGHRRANCNKLPIQHNRNGSYSYNQNNLNNRRPPRNYNNQSFGNKYNRRDYNNNEYKFSGNGPSQ
ncbi:hypothetical protein AYI69_g1920 [Smittium culicis]|uniref:CCHC-type domain-containing protein n=1 Tax=Smittium culicis TaxID=133412 RepID=A0A1R1YP28_9FUNG|nr:hypothetical protein AYI69_g1920 [Smittium culicis]